MGMMINALVFVILGNVGKFLGLPELLSLMHIMVIIVFD
jgi:hypothetical protein